MHMQGMFTLLPIISLLIYLIPIVFIGWFLLRYLKIQEQKNEILRTIADRMNKTDERV